MSTWYEDDQKLLRAISDNIGDDFPKFGDRVQVEAYSRDWNPLHNDEDIFDLMIRYNISVNFHDGTTVSAVNHDLRKSMNLLGSNVEIKHDPAYLLDCTKEATRRAVILCAAEICKAKEDK